MWRGTSAAGLAVVLMWLLTASFAAEPAGQAGLKAPPGVQPNQVRRHVEFLAAPERAGRGDEASKGPVRDYLAAQYQKLGLLPLFPGPKSDGDEPAAPSYLQTIPGPKQPDGAVPVRGANLGAWLPGRDPALRDEFIVLCAHYDHLGVRKGRVFPGADDNAASVAMVLEVARQLSALPPAERPRRSVVFLHTDLEEQLLWGARWFVAHPPWKLERVKALLVADLLGRSLGDLPLPAVFVLGSETAPQLDAVLNDVAPPAGLSAARLGIDIVGTRSDYGPFRDKEIPFLFFSTGEHPDYHTPHDVPERIDYDKLARITTYVARLARRLASDDQAPVWQPATPSGLEEAHALHAITGLLLQDDPRRPLSDAQRAFLQQLHDKTGVLRARGTVTPAERASLVRSAQWLLFSIF